jgi:predicted aspartyl protease
VNPRAAARCATGIAVFYCTFAGYCHRVQAQSEVRFRLVHDTLIVVSMKVADQGSFDFVLDTGADITIVDRSVANAVSLVSRGSVEQTTLAGGRTLIRSSVRRMVMGPGSVKNLPVLVEDLSDLRKMDPSIEGIAGQNFLSHFNYLLDYRKHWVRIERADEIQRSICGDRVPIAGSGNRMIVASEVQSVGRATLHLLLDSGANTLILLPAASHELALSARESGTETTSGGRVVLQMGRIHTLKVGSQQFRDIAVVLARTAPAEHIGDGLLPTALFRSLYVNNREGFVVLNPRAKKN